MLRPRAAVSSDALAIPSRCCWPRCGSRLPHGRAKYGQCSGWIAAARQRSLYTHRAAVKKDDRVESRSICDGSTRQEVSADGRCRCRIARRPRQQMRAVAVAPPGRLLLAWPEPSSFQLTTWSMEGVHVATSCHQVRLFDRDLQLGLRAHHAHMPQRALRQSRTPATVKCSPINLVHLKAQPRTV